MTTIHHTNYRFHTSNDSKTKIWKNVNIKLHVLRSTIYTAIQLFQVTSVRMLQVIRLCLSIFILTTGSSRSRGRPHNSRTTETERWVINTIQTTETDKGKQNVSTEMTSTFGITYENGTPKLGYHQRDLRSRQDRHCTYNVTMRRPCNHCCSGKVISITYSECVFSLRYPACNAHAPYCHLWPARLYYIFLHVTKGTIFGGEKNYWT